MIDTTSECVVSHTDAKIAIRFTSIFLYLEPAPSRSSARKGLLEMLTYAC